MGRNICAFQQCSKQLDLVDVEPALDVRHVRVAAAFPSFLKDLDRMSLPDRDAMLLDVSRLVWRAWRGLLPTGIDRTCLAYVARYRDRAQAVLQGNQVTRVVSPEISRALFDILLDQGATDQRRRLRRLGWRAAARLLLGRARQRDIAGRLYINVGHTGLDRPHHATWIKQSGVRPLYYVHDLIPLTHPEYCRPGEPDKHLRRMTVVLQHAIGILSNSRDTLNVLAVFAGLQQSLAMPPALVAPPGVEVGTQASSKPVRQPLPARPYFVMIGTIEGRKNHLLILTIWAELARRLGSACPQLVIVGQRGWECEQTVDILERCDAIRGHVIELPRCDDELLAAYIRGARALLFPSFVEGYGLPLVEALASGTPVVASDLVVFRELAGVIPDYLSPIDGLGWARAIEEYAQPDSSMRAAQFARLEGWRPLSWNDHFAKVERWLDQISATPPPPASMPTG